MAFKLVCAETGSKCPFEVVAESKEELMQHVGRLAGSRIAVVLDTGVPSIDLPTFASVASALPSRTHVVLWGTDERQKRRVVDMFPQARAWVASGSAESPIELLGEP